MSSINNPFQLQNLQNRVYREGQDIPRDIAFPTAGSVGPSVLKPFVGPENETLSSIISNDGNFQGRRSLDLKDIDPSGRNALLDIPSFLFYPQDLGKNRRYHHFITFNIYQGTSDEVQLQTRQNNLMTSTFLAKGGYGAGTQLAGSEQQARVTLGQVGFTQEQITQFVNAFVGATGTLQSLGITTDERINALERTLNGEFINLFNDAQVDENGVKRVDAGVVSSTLSSIGGQFANIATESVQFLAAFIEAGYRDNTSEANRPRMNSEEVGVRKNPDGTRRKVNKPLNEQMILLANRRFNLANVKSKDTICLYMPQKIAFNDNLIYSEEDMGMSKVVLDSVLMKRGAISAGVEKVAVSGVANLINQATGMVGLEGVNLQAVRNAATRSVANPRREAMFRDVGLRTHSFSFQFAPRNPEEADTVLNIIRMFRYHAHPGLRGGGGHFFTFPAEFQVSFHTITEGGIVLTNDNLPKLPRLALQSISVDYSDAGDFKTFTDAKPAFIRLDLQFQEMEQLTNEHIIHGY
jgi:hypothetical protein